MRRIDTLTEELSRAIARRSSRRSFLALFSGLLVGSAGPPLLPVARGSDGKGPPPTGPNTGQLPPQSTGNPQDPGDPSSCDYWRYCAIDGMLCSCCGGAVNA